MPGHLASGNGISCPGDPQPDSLEAGIVEENTVYEMGHHYAAALTAAGIPHTEDFYGCGSHIPLYTQRDVHAFWPLMVAAFGTRPPSTFNYRTADPTFTVWGWTFHADPERADEFLDIRNASSAGLAVTGSRRESITTGPLFAPGGQVLVSGASSATSVATASSEGRITFTVDLGQAHTLQQYTAAELLVQSTTPTYFISRTVSFTSLGQ